MTESQPPVDYPPPSTEQRSSDQPSHPAPVVHHAQAPRGGFGRGFGMGTGIGLGLGVAGVVASLVMGVFLVISAAVVAGSGSTSASTETTTIWGSGDQKIRAVEISGPIMAEASDGGLLASGTYGYEIASQIDALKKEDASAVVLLVNTPGGSIGGSRAISDAIERYQERTGQKVLVHVSSMSASGGVYATAPADEIIADHGSLVGSIGVIMGPFVQYSDVVSTGSSLLEAGVTTTGGITSEYLSAGTGKDFGNPFRGMTEAERTHYQAGIDAEYRQFVAHVSKHRDIPEATITDTFGAFMFDPHAAKENGLIDDVQGREDFFRHAAEAAGLNPDTTRVEAVAEPSGFASLLGVTRAIGHAPAVEQGQGVVPVVNAHVCGGRRPLAFAGDVSSVCG